MRVCVWIKIHLSYIKTLPLQCLSFYKGQGTITHQLSIQQARDRTCHTVHVHVHACSCPWNVYDSSEAHLRTIMKPLGKNHPPVKVPNSYTRTNKKALHRVDILVILRARNLSMFGPSPKQILVYVFDISMHTHVRAVFDDLLITRSFGMHSSSYTHVK